MGWYRRFTNLLRSQRVSADIEREMAFHLDERADELMAGGMSEADARREARRRFGNASVQKERTRDADVLTWLESLGADVRYAVRALRASPAFALVTIGSLGLGIGANTAIFTLINAVVLKSLPVSHPEELVQVTMGAPSETSQGSWFTNPIWEQVRDRQGVLSGVFAYGPTQFDLTAGGEMRRVDAYWVSGDFFSTLGVRPALGRLVAHSDDVRGCPPVAVLGHGFWQSEYGGSPSVIGKTISLDRTPYTIIGVADRSFFGINIGESRKVYAVLCQNPNLDQRSHWFLQIVGRPKEGVTPAQVAAHLARIAPDVFGASIPQDWGVRQKADYAKQTLGARPAAEKLSSVRREYEKALIVLMAVVAAVLLIACANVANLLLARAATRSREMAIRLAIGAARRRLVRQLLTESVLLAGLGALVGVVFARWGSRLLVGMLAHGAVPVAVELDVDVRVLAFTLTVAVATGILFGLAPAWRSARLDPQATLKAGGRGVVSGHSRFTIGKALVTGQVAHSLVLVVGAGLLLGSFRKLTTFDPGFRRDGVLLVSVNLARAGYKQETYATTERDLLTRFRALPGVESVSASVITPIEGGGWNDMIHVEGFQAKSEGDALVFFNQVTDQFFTTLGTSVLAGRDFDDRDRVGSPVVAIVNEAMAKKYFGASSPLGKQYRLALHDTLGPPVEIIGVVKDAKYLDLRETTAPTIYLSWWQGDNSWPSLSYELRSRLPTSELAPRIKAAVADVSRAIPLELKPLAAQVDASLTRDRLLATLSGFFGALALLLATVGLYGTLSYSVARRRNEIGIRIALGAARARVIRLVLGEVTRMIVIGILLGLATAIVSARLVQAFLYGMTPSDPWTLAGAAVILAAVGLAAGTLPAWRAARVDPIAALREE
jgi:predicted permease